MSPKLRVESQKDEHGHLNWLKIFRGGKNKPELQLSEIWDADGLTSQITFDGKREAMPSVMDIVSLFHQSFIERIGLVKLINLIETIETVETIDLVSLISLIVEVTNIKNIESVDLIDLITEITKIGSVKVIGKDASSVERRSIITNNGTTSLWLNVTGNNRRAKFFTSHMMGFINTIDVYCKDNGAAGGTITVYISPNSSLGYVASATVTVPAGGGADWRSATFNRTWLSDKLFIFVVGSTADMQWAYDDEDTSKRDEFSSSDAGATWAHGNARMWFRVVMKGETEGDANVTGTVNTIEIPSVTTARQFVHLENIGTETAKYDTTQVGAGETLIVMFIVNSDEDRDTLRPRILCDGQLVLPMDITMYTWNERVSVSTPGITIGAYNETDKRYVLVVTVPFPFKRTLQVGFYNITIAGVRDGYVAYSYKKSG